MTDQAILEGLVRDVQALKAEVQRLQALSPLYQIVNVTRTIPAATENNWAIDNVDKINIEASGATFTLNGIANGKDGRILILENSKAGVTVTINHNNAGASAGNKILTPTAAAITLAAGRSAILSYSYEVGLTDYAWRVLVFSA